MRDVDPTANFARLVGLDDPPLDELAGTIAAHHTAGLEVQQICRRLDELSEGFTGSSGSQLLRYLTGECGFRGNAEQYYDERNSMLDHVIGRRLGIPITLSIVMIEVGRRVGVELVGVGMPGEFLVRERHDATAFHNVFRGVELDRVGVEELFIGLHGPTARFSDAMVAPTGPIEIAARMLANLMHIYLQTQDRASLIWVLRLRTMLPGASVAELRQLAGVLEAAGRFWEAAAVVEHLRALQPERSDDLDRTVRRLRAGLN